LPIFSNLIVEMPPSVVASTNRPSLSSLKSRQAKIQAIVMLGCKNRLCHSGGILGW
jgi:hypothetical protein